MQWIFFKADGSDDHIGVFYSRYMMLWILVDFSENLFRLSDYCAKVSQQVKKMRVAHRITSCRTSKKDMDTPLDCYSTHEQGPNGCVWRRYVMYYYKHTATFLVQNHLIFRIQTTYYAGVIKFTFKWVGFTYSYF